MTTFSIYLPYGEVASSFEDTCEFDSREEAVEYWYKHFGKRIDRDTIGNYVAEELNEMPNEHEDYDN